MQWRQRLARVWVDEGGLTAVEYALLIAWIGAIVALAMLTLSGVLGDQMDQTATSLDPG